MVDDHPKFKKCYLNSITESLAGRECRSAQRLKAERQKNPIWTLLNLLVMVIPQGSLTVSTRTFTNLVWQ
ncbi:MAG: hypothetical protein ACRC8A_16355 [Microcoleaceae cyanobacterium]